MRPVVHLVLCTLGVARPQDGHNASRLEGVPVLTTTPCPQRVKPLTRLGGRATALISLENHPRNHDEFADIGEHRVTRPLQQVVPVQARESVVFLAAVPAEAVIVDGSLDEIPFPGAGGEVVQVDDHRLTEIIPKHVADVGITMDDALR
jgi:hypothetical protein